jgi:decaprenylphospho-beta-D-erythro-pentofuranosid-2-ulose 2-reductase
MKKVVSHNALTAAFRKGALWAKPARIGRGIVRALERKRSTVYLPWFWRPIMFVVRALPESVFMRLPL